MGVVNLNSQFVWVEEGDPFPSSILIHIKIRPIVHDGNSHTVTEHYCRSDGV